MPSPIAHLAAASLLGPVFSRPHDDTWMRGKIWFLSLFFSLAPDLDVIPALLFRDFIGFHNQASHSITFSVVFVLVMAPLIDTLIRGPGITRALAIGMTGTLMHVLMDWMTWGRGVMLGWPWTDARFMMDPPIFIGLRWSEGVFSAHHLRTMANELVVTLPVIALFWITRIRLRKSADA